MLKEITCIIILDISSHLQWWNRQLQERLINMYHRMPAIKATKEKDTDLTERHAGTDNKHSQTKGVGYNNTAVTLAKPLYLLVN